MTSKIDGLVLFFSLPLLPFCYPELLITLNLKIIFQPVLSCAKGIKQKVACPHLWAEHSKVKQRPLQPPVGENSNW
jgi:hypothetical protein